MRLIKAIIVNKCPYWEGASGALLNSLTFGNVISFSMPLPSIAPIKSKDRNNGKIAKVENSGMEGAEEFGLVGLLPLGGREGSRTDEAEAALVVTGN